MTTYETMQTSKPNGRTTYVGRVVVDGRVIATTVRRYTSRSGALAAARKITAQ